MKFHQLMCLCSVVILAPKLDDSHARYLAIFCLAVSFVSGLISKQPE